MNLTLNQFETLVYIERHQNDKCTQRRLAKKLDLSLGVINKTLTELQDSEVFKTRGRPKTMGSLMPNSAGPMATLATAR